MQAKTSLEDLHLSRLLSRPPGSLQGPVLGFLAQKVIAGAGTPWVSFLLSIVNTSPSKYLSDFFNLDLVSIDAEPPPEAWQAKVGEEYCEEGNLQGHPGFGCKDCLPLYVFCPLWRQNMM